MFNVQSLGLIWIRTGPLAVQGQSQLGVGPAGGGVELKLRSHPGGSASGFTSVLIPPTEPPPPPADHTPVITGTHLYLQSASHVMTVY